MELVSSQLNLYASLMFTLYTVMHALSHKVKCLLLMYVLLHEHYRVHVLVIIIHLLCVCHVMLKSHYHQCKFLLSEDMSVSDEDMLRVANRFRDKIH